MVFLRKLNRLMYRTFCHRASLLHSRRQEDLVYVEAMQRMVQLMTQLEAVGLAPRVVGESEAAFTLCVPSGGKTFLAFVDVWRDQVSVYEFPDVFGNGGDSDLRQPSCGRMTHGQESSHC